LKRYCTGILSNHSNTFMSSETMLLVSLPITCKALLLTRMWVGNVSTITFLIHRLPALWPIICVNGAIQLHICCCEDGMHRLDGCSRICIVSGYSSGTLEGGQMNDNLEYFIEVLGLFLVFYLLYNDICHIQARRAVLRVHVVGIHRWDVCFLERHSASDRTLYMAIMLFAVQYLQPAEVCQNE